MPTLTGAFAFTVVAQTAAAVVHLVGLRSLTPPAPSGDGAGTRRAAAGSVSCGRTRPPRAAGHLRPGREPAGCRRGALAGPVLTAVGVAGLGLATTTLVAVVVGWTVLHQLRAVAHRA